MTSIAFFNNKGGVGKTTLVYHLAHMFVDHGHRVLLVDLDPQSNLTAMCLSEDRMEELWESSVDHHTVLGAVEPILKGLGDVLHIDPVALLPGLDLMPGDLGLSRFEDRLSDAWPRSLDGDEAAWRTLTAFHRLARHAAAARNASLILIDVGPNLGAINRSALLGADHVITPVAPDLYSVQGLRNLGPTLAEWRTGWDRRRASAPPQDLDLPSGSMNPLGYVIMQSGMRLDRPVKAYSRWTARLPAVYHHELLADGVAPEGHEDDDSCLGVMRNYQSLMPLAQDARKPMFRLKPGDGAIGAHQDAVRRCHDEFDGLAARILGRLPM